MYESKSYLQFLEKSIRHVIILFIRHILCYVLIQVIYGPEYIFQTGSINIDTREVTLNNRGSIYIFLEKWSQLSLAICVLARTYPWYYIVENTSPMRKGYLTLLYNHNKVMGRRGRKLESGRPSVRAPVCRSNFSGLLLQFCFNFIETL